MFIRAKFVTNSSSTCFLAYGIKLPGKYPLDENGEYLRENDDKNDWHDWYSYYHKMTNTSWSDDLPVAFADTAEDDDAVLFVEDSRIWIEYGYGALNKEIDPKWDNEIRKACELLNVSYKQPSWFGWYTGMAG